MMDFIFSSWRGLDLSPSSAAPWHGRALLWAHRRSQMPTCSPGSRAIFRAGVVMVDSPSLSVPAEFITFTRIFLAARKGDRPVPGSCSPHAPPTPRTLFRAAAWTRSHSHVLGSWEWCGLPQPQELEDAYEGAASLVHLNEVEPHFWVWEDTGFERSWLSYPELGLWPSLGARWVW